MLHVVKLGGGGVCCMGWVGIYTHTLVLLTADGDGVKQRASEIDDIAG